MPKGVPKGLVIEERHVVAGGKTLAMSKYLCVLAQVRAGELDSGDIAKHCDITKGMAQAAISVALAELKKEKGDLPSS